MKLCKTILLFCVVVFLCSSCAEDEVVDNFKVVLNPKEPVVNTGPITHNGVELEEPSVIFSFEMKNENTDKVIIVREAFVEVTNLFTGIKNTFDFSPNDETFQDASDDSINYSHYDVLGPGEIASETPHYDRVKVGGFTACSPDPIPTPIPTECTRAPWSLGVGDLSNDDSSFALPRYKIRFVLSGLIADGDGTQSSKENAVSDADRRFSKVKTFFTR